MNKIKKFFTSVFGIKITLSVVLGIVVLLVAKINLSATFIIAAFIVGIWIDEVLSAILKLATKKEVNIEKVEEANSNEPLNNLRSK